MARALQQLESRLFAVMRRKPPETRLQRASFRLFVSFVLCSLLALLPGVLGSIFNALKWSVVLPLIVCGSILLSRWVVRRLLWNVRNRLIVTYLLMGLAPLVLFVTLALLASYVFAGQFATFAASSAFNDTLADLASQNRAFAMHVSHELAIHPKTQSVDLPEFTPVNRTLAHSQLGVAAFDDGRKVMIAGAEDGPASVDTLPGWVKDGYEGVVADGGRLYLRAVNTQSLGSHVAAVVSSIPLDKEVVSQVAAGLGTVRVFSKSQLFQEQPRKRSGDARSEDARPGDTQSGDARAGSGAQGASPARANTGNESRPALTMDWSTEDGKTAYAEGGTLPPAKHLFDVIVGFGAPLHVVDWNTGKTEIIGLVVTSRPTLLYDRLFTTSLNWGAVLQNILIGIGIFFGFIELVAFLMAVRLNQTITQSIHELYGATMQIDQGHLEHRIRVRRRDQLGALSEAFNRMAVSLGRLLAEQREKQRLQSELAIAQEVQENLFPRSSIAVPTLELHGVCRPARTVSGDYYDFLLCGETQLCLALGDISGKGISAALLMATLHSAVRAYLFAGEEMERPAMAGHFNSRFADEESGNLFDSPGKMLEVLNRHLYRSTQPEKYATLFLANYDTRESKLTYSNGGQLPPLVLCVDGTVQRLDCGGSVVGLLDGLRYEEGSVRLRSGDLLIAYSDGVTEPENEFGDFGEERLLEVVQRNRHLPLAAISDQVMQALRAWIGEQEQPDDITLVLARQI